MCSLVKKRGDETYLQIWCLESLLPSKAATDTHSLQLILHVHWTTAQIWEGGVTLALQLKKNSDLDEHDSAFKATTGMSKLFWPISMNCKQA